MSTKNTGQIDAKREEFRKYLEKEGVLESLTKALVALYEEPDKPSDALSFVRNNFAASEMQTIKAQLENLTKENDQLKNKITTLEDEKAKLETRVHELEDLQVNAAAAVAAKPDDSPTRSPAAKIPSEDATFPSDAEPPTAAGDQEKIQEPDNSATIEDAPSKSPAKSDSEKATTAEQTSPQNDTLDRCESPKKPDQEQISSATEKPSEAADNPADPKSVDAMETDDAVQDE